MLNERLCILRNIKGLGAFNCAHDFLVQNRSEPWLIKSNHAPASILYRLVKIASKRWSSGCDPLSRLGRATVVGLVELDQFLDVSSKVSVVQVRTFLNRRVEGVDDPELPLDNEQGRQQRNNISLPEAIVSSECFTEGTSFSDGS